MYTFITHILLALFLIHPLNAMDHDHGRPWELKSKEASKKPKHHKKHLGAYTNPIVRTQNVFTEENQMNIQNADATTNEEMRRNPHLYPLQYSNNPSATMLQQAIIPRVSGVADMVYNSG